ncbi:MAG: GIY-YIG nuclease family protein [Chthoniobacterales bacterium]
MAWVYILQGSSGRYYIGSTENLERRLAEHRRGGNHTTRRLGSDFNVVVIRWVQTAGEARRIEFALKRKRNPRLAIYALEQLP